MHGKISDEVLRAFPLVEIEELMGNGRTYEYVVALRAVRPKGFMTAHWAALAYTPLAKLCNRIINKVCGAVLGKIHATVAAYAQRRWGVDYSQDHRLSEPEFQLALANQNEITSIDSSALAPGCHGQDRKALT
jgi:GMP synthase C terminal domain